MSVIKWKHEYTAVVLFLLTKLLLVGLSNYSIFSNIMCLFHIASAILLIVIWMDKIFRKQLFAGAFIALVGMFFPYLFGYYGDGFVGNGLYDLVLKVGGCIGLLLLAIIFCKSWSKSNRLMPFVDVAVSFFMLAIIFMVALNSINISSVSLPAETAEYEVDGEAAYTRHSCIYPVKAINSNNSDFTELEVSRTYDLLPGDKITVEYRKGVFYDIYKVIEVAPERILE